MSTTIQLFSIPSHSAKFPSIYLVRRRFTCKGGRKVAGEEKVCGSPRILHPQITSIRTKKPVEEVQYPISVNRRVRRSNQIPYQWNNNCVNSSCIFQKLRHDYEHKLSVLRGQKEEESLLSQKRNQEKVENLNVLSCLLNFDKKILEQ